MLSNLGQISPTLEEFRELARSHRVISVSASVLADSLTPIGLYRALCLDDDGAARPGTFLLESAAQGGVWSRYSFVGINSAATLSAIGAEARWQGTVPEGLPRTGESIDVLARSLEALSGKAAGDFAFMSSGMIGYLGWESIRHWEKLPNKPVDDLGVPEIAMNLVADMAVYDNADATTTVIANAINFDGSDERVDEAWHECVARLRAVVARLDGTQPGAAGPLSESVVAAIKPDGESVKETWDESGYREALSQAHRHIVDGDIFQIVLSRRFEAQSTADPLPIYRVLRANNPSPYMYLFNFEDPRDGRPYAVVGSSPEALVTVQGNDVVTHPIAGSRPRGEDMAQDQANAASLLADVKEKSEHLMLVDLARNDLSKVCVPGSVRVSEFMEIEKFSHIMHLVSTVNGTLKPDATSVDVLAATFPAGTLSGAPKPRALALIDQYEPVQRGVYGGVVGYIDFAGNMDMAIAIRSALLRDETAYVQAGGGIVADSNDDDETLESLNKARAPLLAAITASKLEPARLRVVGPDTATHG